MGSLLMGCCDSFLSEQDQRTHTAIMDTLVQLSRVPAVAEHLLRSGIAAWLVMRCQRLLRLSRESSTAPLALLTSGHRRTTTKQVLCHKYGSDVVVAKPSVIYG